MAYIGRKNGIITYFAHFSCSGSLKSWYTEKGRTPKPNRCIRDMLGYPSCYYGHHIGLNDSFSLPPRSVDQDVAISMVGYGGI